MKRLFFIFLLVPVVLFAQETDSELNAEADSLLTNSARNNNAKYFNRILKNIIANKPNSFGAPTFTAGSNISITGSWPSLTISQSGGAGAYPSAGPAISNGSAWVSPPSNSFGPLTNNGSGSFSYNTFGSLLNSSVTGLIPYISGSNSYSMVSVGSNNQVLKLVGGVPVWASYSGGWTSVTLNSSALWVSATVTVRYKVDSDGRCYLSGNITQSGSGHGDPVAINTTALPLYSGGLDVYFPIVNEGGQTISILRISSSGIMTITGGAGRAYNDVLSLEGINYSTN